MLYLAIHKRRPGYVDGQVSIGLIEADGPSEAAEKASEAMQPWKPGRDEITIAAVGEMVDIATLPTNYRG